MATIRKVKRTGNWEAQVYRGRNPVTGKAQFETKTCTTQKEAKEWATKLESQRNEGQLAPTVSKVSFADYLRDSWLPSYRTQVRSTYTIEKALGKWIFTPQDDTPFLGRLSLRKLAVADFDKLYVAMAAKGMRARGIAHLHGLLKRALKFAVKKGELSRNPAEFATLPKPNVNADITTTDDENLGGPVEFLTKEQAARFLRAVKSDRQSALWHVLLDGGLRPGEAFALKWSHVDWKRSMVKVRATLVRHGVKQAPTDQGWKLTRPKTESSIGDVPLSVATMQELGRWKKTQAEERLRVGPEWQDHGFVFTTEFGSPLGNNMGRAWERVLAAADGGRGDLGRWEERERKSRGPAPQRSFTPRFCMYVLRHTCATLALLDGVDLLTVSRRLRHKNITITASFYGHVKAEHSTAVAESFQRLVASVR